MFCISGGKQPQEILVCIGNGCGQYLSRVLAANEKRFREVERRAAVVIEAITNSGIKYDEGEEAVDVCQAIQEMRKESEQKKAMEVAEKLHEMGLDTEKIAQAAIFNLCHRNLGTNRQKY